MSEVPTTASLIEAAFKEIQEAQPASEDKLVPTPQPDAQAVAPESADGKSESAQADDQKEYTAEDLDRLSKELGAQAADELDDDKLKDQVLVDKKKAMDRIFDAKMKDINTQLDQLQQAQREVREALETINKQREKYKELVGEDAEEDPKIKELTQRQSQIESQYNWMQADRAVRETFPDFGLYGDDEMMATLKEYPELMDLAKVGNGKFGALVMAGVHMLTQRKPDNWKKLIANELETNYEAHKPVLDKVLRRRIDELNHRTEQKRSITTTARKMEVPVQENTDNFKDFKSAVLYYADHPEEAKKIAG